MSRIVTFTLVTLDGVVQGPGHPDEDRRDGFDLGGWSPPYADEIQSRLVAAGMAASDRLLFGRRTYEQFAAVWANGPADSPFTRVLNDRLKYVASSTLAEPLPWANSRLLAGDSTAAVAELRSRPGPDVVILGSATLVRSLLASGLIDELVLVEHPIVLGRGHRLFVDGMPPVDLRLVDATPTTTGVLVARYRPTAAHRA
jgi:dihydrofolate reductase